MVNSSVFWSQTFCLLLVFYRGKIALTDSGIMFLLQGFQVKGENSAFAGYTVK